MILTKEDLKRYLEADRKALGYERKKPKLLGDRVWKYQILYRKTEYYWNQRNRNIFWKVIGHAANYYFKHKSIKLCNEIALNVIDEGLQIWHGHGIMINRNCKIGKNFSVTANCIVGQGHGQSPTLGDNVEMGIGSKILGGITICDNVQIGAAACVVKDINVPHSTWGGVPARMLREKKDV